MDWDHIFLTGWIFIKQTKSDCAPRRFIQIKIKRKKHVFTLARIIWRCMHPEEILTSQYDIHHKDGNRLNDCPENLEKIEHSLHRIKHAPWNRQKALELRTNGLTYKEIGEIIGVHQSTIRKYISRTVSIDRPMFKGKQRTWDTNLAIQLIKEGYRFEEIAIQMNISVNAIGNYLNKMGYKNVKKLKKITRAKKKEFKRGWYCKDCNEVFWKWNNHNEETYNPLCPKCNIDLEYETEEDVNKRMAKYRF